MNGTRLYWVEGSWPGKVALAARPRGGDWLEDDITGWKRNGVDVVLSLLTNEEESDLDLANEASTVRTQGMEFLSLPTPDRQVPYSETEVAAILDALNSALTAARNVVIHCRQGVGRSGLVAACLLASKGLDSRSAVNKVSIARGVDVPETREQREWIDHYAAILPTLK